MLGFWFKKNFCDGWDNMFHMLVPNIVVMVTCAACAFMCMGINSIDMNDGYKLVLNFIAVAFSAGLVSTFIFAEGDNLVRIANFDSPSLKNFFKQIKGCVKDGFLFGLLLAVIYMVITITLPYYLNMWLPQDGSQGTLLGLVFLSIIFWCTVITLLALIWFIPIRSIMHNNFKKCLKKCFIILMDNTWFTIVVALNDILIIALSIFLVGFYPGFTGLNLAHVNALRLRLYKYDWYEVNPGMSKQERKDVPWEDLLAADKETLGPRKWKTFLFPWKE